MNYHWINERIAVGQKIDSQEFADALQADGVTHVINLWNGHPEPFWRGEVLTLKQEDDNTPRPVDQTRAGVAYAFKALTEGGKLYIHCQWGLRRAPTMTYAILRRFGFSREEAIQLINARRPVAATQDWEHYIASVEAAF